MNINIKQCPICSALLHIKYLNHHEVNIYNQYCCSFKNSSGISHYKVNNTINRGLVVWITLGQYCIEGILQDKIYNVYLENSVSKTDSYIYSNKLLQLPDNIDLSQPDKLLKKIKTLLPFT